MNKRKYYNQLTQEEFENRVKNKNSKLKIIGKYTNRNCNIKYLCKNCGCEWVKKASSLMQGYVGCGVCDGREVVYGINDIYTTRKDLLHFFVNKEDAKIVKINSSKNIKMKCPICGEIREYSMSSLSNNNFMFPCPKCGKGYSYPNKFMYCLLSQIGVDFIREKSFEWSYPRRYDFVVGNNIIEMDGAFHKGSKYNQYEDAKEIDILKDRLAIDNGYNIIRIPCYKSDFLKIKTEVINKLKNIIDLTNVDWTALEKELINTNLVKIVCEEYEKLKYDYNIKQISKMLHFDNYEMFTNLLREGTRIGLINYNPNEFKGINISRTKSKNSKKVICTTENKVFDNIAECSRYYNTTWDTIDRICKGNRLSWNNLEFDFVDTTKEIQDKKHKMRINKNKKSHSQKKVLCIETNEIFNSATECCNYYKCGKSYISDVINIHNGYAQKLNLHFKYIKE